MYLGWGSSGAYIEVASPPSSHAHSKSLDSTASSRTSTTDSLLDIARGPRDVSRNTSLTSTESIKLDRAIGLLREEEEEEFGDHTPIIDRVLKRNSFIPTRPAPKPPGYSARPQSAMKRKPFPFESWIDLSEDDEDDEEEEGEALDALKELDEPEEEEPMPCQPYRRRKRSIVSERRQSMAMQKIEGDIMRMLMENSTLEDTEPLRLPSKEPLPPIRRGAPHVEKKAERRQSTFGSFMSKMKRTLSTRKVEPVHTLHEFDWNSKRGSYFEFDHTY